MADAIKPAPREQSVEMPPLPEGWHVQSYDVLSDGCLAILGADIDIWAEFAKLRDSGLGGIPSSAAKATAKIWTFDGSSLAAGPIFPLHKPGLIVARFPDGRWLVCNSTCVERPSGRILSSDGDWIGSIELGYCVNNIKIDNASRIWVNWIDQGIFGNDSWTVSNLEWSPASYGLVCFDEFGEVVRHARSCPHAVGIADCFALNVIGCTAWASTDPDSFLVALRDKQEEQWWATGLKASRAIAVDEPYILAAGGYDFASRAEKESAPASRIAGLDLSDNGRRVSLLRLADGQAELYGQWEMPIQVGFPNSLDLIDGQGDTLHIVDEDVWRRWRVRDFLNE